MNNKGFTLVELLAVISIIAILSIIAVPNVVSVIDNNKKDQMLSDAKKMISQAKYQVTMDKTIRQSGSYKFYLSSLKTTDIGMDPDGGEYKKTTSYVEYKLVESVPTYCIHLESSKRMIGTTTAPCVEEINLESRTIVKDIK